MLYIVCTIAKPSETFVLCSLRVLLLRLHCFPTNPASYVVNSVDGLLPLFFLFAILTGDEPVGLSRGPRTPRNGYFEKRTPPSPSRTYSTYRTEESLRKKKKKKKKTLI